MEQHIDDDFDLIFDGQDLQENDVDPAFNFDGIPPLRLDDLGTDLQRAQCWERYLQNTAGGKIITFYLGLGDNLFDQATNLRVTLRANGREHTTQHTLQLTSGTLSIKQKMPRFAVFQAGCLNQPLYVDISIEAFFLVSQQTRSMSMSIKAAAKPRNFPSDVCQARKSAYARMKAMEEELFASIRTDNNPVLLALIRAATEVINGSKIAPSPSAYFAVIMNTLETTVPKSEQEDPEEEMEEDDDDEGEVSNEDEKQKTAALTLLSTLISSLPPAVITAKIQVISEALIKLSRTYSQSKSQTMLKTMLKCIADILCALPDNASWMQNGTQNLFKLLCGNIVDGKPRVRKTAGNNVSRVLHTCPSGNPKNKYSQIFVSFCQQVIRPRAGKREAIREENNKSEEILLMRVLESLRLSMDTLPLASLRVLVQDLFDLDTLTHPIITLLVLSCFDSLFSAEAADLNAEFTDTLLGSLYQFSPSPSDVKMASLFARLITAATKKLSTLDTTATSLKLPQSMKSIIPNFASESSEVAKVTEECMKGLIFNCIDEKMIEAAVAAAKTNANVTPLQNIIESVQNCLRFPYKHNWSNILSVQAALFTQIDEASNPLLLGLAKYLGDMYDTPDFMSEEITPAFMATLKEMTAVLGPEKTIEILPLNIENEELGLRAWLLPILETSISGARLEFFVQYFLPLSQRVKKRCQEAEKAGKGYEAKNWAIIFIQIWALWPRFCIRCTDIDKTFKSVAQSLGQLLTSEPQLREKICKGLNTLIKSNKPDSKKAVYPPEQAASNLKAITVFTKNFLPILFNIFTDEATSKEDRRAVNKTASNFVSASDPKTVMPFFKTVMNKLIEEGNKEEDRKPFVQQNLVDLLNVFVPHLDHENATLIYKTIKPLLESKDGEVQKKSYKTLGILCAHHIKMIEGRLEEVKKIISDSIGSSHPGIKRHRLICIRYLLDKLTPEEMNKMLGHVISCAKEVKGNIKEVAYKVIRDMVNDRIEKEIDNPVSSVIELVIAGLAGTSPMMTSATINVLSRLLSDYCEELTPEFQSNLLHPILICLLTKNREIIKSSIEFIRVALTVMPEEAIDPHFDTMVGNIFSMGKDEKNYFRMPIRRLLEKLIRKYGFERVNETAPEEEQKLLSHIRKAERKRKKGSSVAGDFSEKGSVAPSELRSRATSKASVSRASMGSRNPATFEEALYGTDDDLSDDEGESKEIYNKKSAQNRTRLVETDEPMDLVDIKSVKNVISGAGAKKQKRVQIQTGDNLAFDERGRLIIGVGSDKKKKKEKGKLPDNLDYMMMLEEQDMERKKSKKRRLEEDDDDEDDRSMAPSMDARSTLSKSSRKTTDSKRSVKRQKGEKKQSGGVQPFAYMPLDPKLLNKRTNKKAAGQLKSIVNAAKKGSKTQRAHPRTRR
ncbi:hypothetical protein PROFUN_02739 [Planoprotostelium fungivorum]|uniref:Uncharacterized protein n=1 Tax=Planoprotostelium fungivorum TaxID=1890364 RepID=A0A2P6NXF6_9EUKA|nr:hypothetical protein PROFUN_02739 [Planoprotostelium fungivorum]